jgi:hypothetical protein
MDALSYSTRLTVVKSPAVQDIPFTLPQFGVTSLSEIFKHGMDVIVPLDVIFILVGGAKTLEESHE